MAVNKTLAYDEALDRLSGGVDQLFHTVGATMGPKGRNTIYEPQYDIPMVTNDGITIAKNLGSADRVEDIAIQILREAAQKTENEAGDGTTTTMVLGGYIFREGYKNVMAGANPIQIRKGMEQAAKMAEEIIRRDAIPCEDIDMVRKVATISGNNDPLIGDLVAQAFEKVGFQGVITVEDSQQPAATVDYSDGIHFEKGLPNKLFATDVTGTADLDHPYILVVNKKLENPKELVSVMQKVMQESRSLVIIAREYADIVMAFLTTNVSRRIIHAAAVEAPGHGDTRQRNMEAIAAMVGAVCIDENCGMSLMNAGLEVLGQAERVFIDKDSTTIHGAAAKDSEAVAQIRNRVKGMLENETADYEIEKLNETLSYLNGGVVTIHAGAFTEPEMFEQRDLLRDAVNAVYAAIDEGIVPGAGREYVNIIREMRDRLPGETNDMRTGADILLRALEAPVRQIAANAGQEGAVILEKMEAESNTVGYNAATDTWEDLLAAGVIDSAKSARLSILNSVSAAGTLLTMGAFVVQDV